MTGRRHYLPDWLVTLVVLVSGLQAILALLTGEFDRATFHLVVILLVTA